MSGKSIIPLLLAFVILYSGVAYSQSVPEESADAVAHKFMLSRDPGHQSDPGRLKISDISIRQNSSHVLYYIINYAEGGFIIITADERFYPVLAYSFRGRFDSGNIPENCRSWINAYESQIEIALENNGPFSIGMPAIWQKMGKTDLAAPSNEVLPLTSSDWSQVGPYNLMCPADEDGYDGHVPAGCVPLAMSQLMYYYRFPVSGIGSEQYTPSYGGGIYGQQHVDFSAATYRWDCMTDICHFPNEAVAQICYHAGVAVKASYAPEATGANIEFVAGALREHFRYKADDYLERYDAGSTQDWVSLLMDDLSERQPVLYRSTQGWAGHAYLCDGFQDSTHFHFNWGWGGAYNGYYYIDNLAPGGINLTESQGAVFNVFPDTSLAEYPVTFSDSIVFTSLSGSFEDGSGLFDYSPGMVRSWTIVPDDPEITNIYLEFSWIETADSTDLIRIYDGNSDTSPLLAICTGHSYNFSVNSSGPVLFITFESGNEVQDNGFHAQYFGYHLPFCSKDQVLTAPSGIVRDGSAFLDYSNGSDCEWIIAPFPSPDDSVAGVSLHFNRLDLASGDTVYIYDGADKLSPLIGKYSGNTAPAGNIFSTGSQVLVNFISDEANNGKGWELAWDYTRPEYCSDTLFYDATEGMISDGSNEKNYVENADCFYVIDLRGSDFIRVSFSEFDLESDYDFVKVFDLNQPNIYLYKFSGHEIPAEVIIPLDKLLVHFHSDSRDNYSGWTLFYSNYGPGVNEPVSSFRMGPNPVREKLIIRSDCHFGSGVSIRVFRPEGAVVYSGKLASPAETINTESWPAGIYFILIDAGDETFCSKIVKIKL